MLRRSLCALLLLAACQALPSGVPLANTGGVLDDDGTARDRQARAPAPAADAVLPSAGPSVALRSGSSTGTEAPPAPSGSAMPASAADAGASTAVWAGDYYGSDKLVRHFEGDADDVELDDKAHTRVEEPSTSALLISIVNSATGDTICALKATVHGTEASVNEGQSCFGEQGATTSLVGGRAAIQAERLTLDFSGKVVSEADEDGDTIEFELEYHFDGKRR
jgi:hypothetical protein